MRHSSIQALKPGLSLVIVLLLAGGNVAGQQKPPASPEQAENVSTIIIGEQQPVSPTNTFSGTTAGGERLSLTVETTGNTVSGFGSLGKRDFAVSGPTLWHAPVILAFDAGPRVSAYLTLSRGRHTLTVKSSGKGFEAPVVLNAGESEVTATGGSFAGRYASSKDELSAISLVLEQRGKLLAGSGFADGRPVAVVGKVTGEREAAGTILFADDSRVTVTVTLAQDGALVIGGTDEGTRLERQ